MAGNETVAAQRGIDHLVLPARDLGALAAFYEKLGFTLTPQNRHPFGTANRIVQFQGSFLELLGLYDDSLIPASSETAFNFAAFNKDFLEKYGHGFSMLVLESADAKADRAAYEAVGLHLFDPFHFSRTAKLPDGSVVTVGFNLTFAADPLMRETSFFTCEQWAPELFWKPEFQRHRNTATGMTEVVFVSADPKSHAAFLEGFSGCIHQAIDGGIAIDTPRGLLTVITPDAVYNRFGRAPVGPSPGLAGYLVGVADMGACESCLEENGIAYDCREGLLVLDPATAFGTVLAFQAV